MASVYSSLTLTLAALVPEMIQGSTTSSSRITRVAAATVRTTLVLARLNDTIINVPGQLLRSWYGL